VTARVDAPASPTSAPPAPETATRERSYSLDILLVSFAGLLLEVAYTRVISYKLFYYYTYLIIGLALLGIGTGGVVVAISRRLREASTDAIIMGSSLLGALSIGVGYVVVATTKVDTLAIWEYDTGASASNVARLLDYLGLPLLLLFALSAQAPLTVLNGEIVAVEVIRALVGSIGIVAAVPLTTAVAAVLIVPRRDHGAA